MTTKTFDEFERNFNRAFLELKSMGLFPPHTQTPEDLSDADCHEVNLRALSYPPPVERKKMITISRAVVVDVPKPPAEVINISFRMPSFSRLKRLFRS